MGRFVMIQVCEDCHLQIGGFDAHEIGHEVPELFSGKRGEGLVDVYPNVPPAECSTCQLEDNLDPEVHFSEEHDVIDQSLNDCDSCGRFHGEYHTGYDMMAVYNN